MLIAPKRVCTWRVRRDSTGRRCWQLGRTARLDLPRTCIQAACRTLQHALEQPRSNLPQRVQHTLLGYLPGASRCVRMCSPSARPNSSSAGIISSGRSAWHIERPSSDPPLVSTTAGLFV